ncbi:hypothetical protein [Limnobaculum parvum]|uniref:hypothetical protein n=1 Tax=Limnobaculum parvum TaxID=2172103 RepID=UPI001864F3EB|nr:hypothetical protein [Limnobaculum parvum]
MTLYRVAMLSLFGTIKADYDVSHVSMSIGSGGGAPFGFPGVPGMPIVVAYGDSGWQYHYSRPKQSTARYCEAQQ